MTNVWRLRAGVEVPAFQWQNWETQIPKWLRPDHYQITRERLYLFVRGDSQVAYPGDWIVQRADGFPQVLPKDAFNGWFLPDTSAPGHIPAVEATVIRAGN